MANGRKNFFDYFKISDDDEEYDEDDDYIFEEDDDDYEYEEPVRKKTKPVQPRATARESAPAARESKRHSYQPTSTATDKLVSFDGGDRRPRQAKSNEVYVIKPQEFDDAQTVADFLKRGQAIVINLEGLQLEPAQRIIDFIGGACYGIEGELKAISASIFIAVPNNIEVSGDLREELLNNNFSPFIGN